MDSDFLKPIPKPGEFDLDIDDTGNPVPHIPDKAWNQQYKAIIDRENGIREQAGRNLYQNYLRYAQEHQNNPEYFDALRRQHLENQKGLEDLFNKRKELYRNKYATENQGKPLQLLENVHQALAEHANNTLPTYNEIVPRLHKKLLEVSPPELPTEEFKYKPPESSKGTNPELQNLVSKRLNTPLRYGNTVVPSAYNGEEKELADASTEVTPTNHYKEPKHIAEAFNSRAKALDTRGVMIGKTSRNFEVRPSVNHAAHLLFGGGLLPPGVAKTLGKAGYKMVIIPNGHKMEHQHPELHEFFQRGHYGTGEAGSNGGVFTGRFKHVQENGNNIGYLHESRQTSVAKSHQETVAGGSALAGRAFYNIIVQKAKKDPATAKAVAGLEQNAHELGFANGSQLMSHLMRHYAMSGYSAASELGDPNHNIFGGQQVFNNEDRDHQLLSFLHNLDERGNAVGKGRAPGLADNVYAILKAAEGGLRKPEHIREQLEHGVPTLKLAGIPVQHLGTPQAKPNFPETEEQNKLLDEEARNFDTKAKVNNLGSTKRPIVEHAIKKALASYVPGVQDLLKDFHVNLHSPESPHPNAKALAKDYAHNELPASDEENQETGMHVAHIGLNNGKFNRQLHMMIPTQKGWHAAREATNAVEDEVGRHVFAALGGFNPEGKIESNTMGNFTYAADRIFRHLPLLFGKTNQDVDRNPEKRYMTDVNPQSPNKGTMGRAAYVFSQLFRRLHEYVQKNNTDHSPSGRMKAYNQFIAKLPNEFLAENLLPLQNRMSAPDFLALKTQLTPYVKTLSDSFSKATKGLYLK